LLDGGWPGNETIARTTIDLNNILLYYSPKTKQLSPRAQRKIFHFVDGIIAGEGNGPLKPQSKPIGVLVGGVNPLAIDIALAKMMGYQPQKIKTLTFGLSHPLSKLNPENISYNFPVKLNGTTTELTGLPNFHFRKPNYWQLAAEE